MKRTKADTLRGNSISDISNQILRDLKQKKLSSSDIKRVLALAIASVPQDEPTIPITIFTKQLTVLESLVKYLREERAYSLHEIAGLLDRNEKNLWHAYQNATTKLPSRLKAKESETVVPVGIFRESALAPLGALVVYLKEQQKLPFHEIAVRLARDDRTIWTTYMRTKKHEKQE